MIKKSTQLIFPLLLSAGIFSFAQFSLAASDHGEHSHDSIETSHKEMEHEDHEHEPHNHEENEQAHEAQGQRENLLAIEDDHDHDADHEGEHGHEHEKEQESLEHAHDHDVTDSDHDHANEEQHDDEHASEGHGHEHEHEHEEDHDESLQLTSAQIKMAGIQIETLEAKLAQFQLYAPGELISNAYLTYIVTPRIDSQVMKRYAVLGDHVKPNQRLVTLFSKEMAQTQAEFLNSANLWNRYRNMKSGAVSNTELNQAKIAFNQARDSLRVLGMSTLDIAKLEKNSADYQGVLGEYTLYASKGGIILGDNFRQGELITAGALMFEIADESELWVEAQLNPHADTELQKDTRAQVIVDNKVYEASVFQSGHTIDEISRTRLIRLKVKNPDHDLHAGQFADVYFQQTLSQAVTALPDGALMKSAEGDWMAFVEESPNKFVSKPLNLGKRLGAQTVVTGIEAGSRVVTQGAFFLASEQAKSGFDIHNH